MASGYQKRIRLAIMAALAAVAAFVIYAQTLREDTWVPPGPPEVAGRVLFERKRCQRCHRVAGVGGIVGPDLSAIALKKDAAWLDVYLQDPRAINPKGKMPKPHLTREQRAAVVAYLRTLDGTPDLGTTAPPVR